MSFETSKAGEALIDGMTMIAYADMIDTGVGFEEYIAQKSPRGYVVGLQIGTMWAAIEGLKVSEIEDWGAWSRQKNDLSMTAIDLIHEGDLWSTSARAYGENAGRTMPLSNFEVQGVRE